MLKGYIKFRFGENILFEFHIEWNVCIKRRKLITVATKIENQFSTTLTTILNTFADPLL